VNVVSLTDDDDDDVPPDDDPVHDPAMASTNEPPTKEWQLPDVDPDPPVVVVVLGLL